MGARLASLSGMRGLAALLVVGYHAVLFYDVAHGAQGIGWSHPLSRYLLGAGWLGVDFFFVLSGFLLARPLLRAPRAIPDRQSYRVFAAKRLLRIAPPYYASFLVIYLLAGRTGHPFFVTDWAGVAVHALYLHNFLPSQQFAFSAVAWTLAIELQFYLLLPLLAAPFRRHPAAALAACFLLSWAWLLWAFVPGDIEATRFRSFQLPGFLAHFGLGIAAAAWIDRPWWRRVHPDLAILAAFALLVVVPAAHFDYTRQFVIPDLLAYHLVVRPAAALAFTVVLVMGLQPRSWFGKAMSTVPLQALGQGSYSLYLVHAAIGGLLFLEAPGLLDDGLVSFVVVATAAALVGAALFYAAVERPSLAWKERVTARMEAEPFA